jgi:hypothetical protein
MLLEGLTAAYVQVVACLTAGRRRPQLGDSPVAQQTAEHREAILGECGL